MKRYIFISTIAALFSFTFSSAGYCAEDTKWSRLVEESGKVLSEVQQMPTKAYLKIYSEKPPEWLYFQIRYRRDLV